MRAALLGAWHVHARDYAREAAAAPDIELAAVWDRDEGRGRAFAAEFGSPFEGDLDRLLSRPDLDGVIVATATSDHPEIIRRAIEAGKHVFSEKVLAKREEDARNLLSLAQGRGVALLLSLPRLSEGSFLKLQELAGRGALGRLTQIRCRVAHGGALAAPGAPDGWLPARFFDPEEAHGGALIDLGAHPIYLANRLAGAPVSVFAKFQFFTGRAVEDSATAVVEYENGVCATLETGFVSAGAPFLLEVYGTEGTAVIEDWVLRIRGLDGKDAAPGGWRVPEPPPSGRTPMRQWVDAAREKSAPGITAKDILDLTRVNAAAARSARSGCAEACR